MWRIFLFVCFCCGIFAAKAQQFSGVRKGDILEVSGVKGIVFTVDDSESHGTMMCIQALRGVKNAWCLNKKYLRRTKAYSETDGRANTEGVFRFTAENGINLDEFPAFAWCKKLGEGWYIPARKELEQFIFYWLGSDNELDWESEDSGIDMENPGDKAKEINRKLIEAGGVPFHNWVYTSTETEKGEVYIFGKNEIRKWWKFFLKGKSAAGQYCVGRAFYRF